MKRGRKNFIVIVLCMFMVPASICYGQTTDVAEGLYRNALSLLNQGLADKALDDFKRIVNNYPTSEFADDAYYLIGKFHYDNQDYTNSLDALNMVINSYGSLDRAPAAYYLKAMIFMDTRYEKADYQDAYANFSRIYSIYSESEWGDRGYYGAGMANYKLKEYAKARDLFRHVADEYPDSEVAAESQYYQGICYAMEHQTVWALQALQKVQDNYSESPFAQKAKGMNSLLFKIYFLPEHGQTHQYKMNNQFQLQNFKFDDARSLAIDSNGNIAIANQGESAIYLFDDRGELLTRDAYSYKPCSVFFDSPGQLAIGFRDRVLMRSQYVRAYIKKKKDVQLDNITDIMTDSRRRLYFLDKSNDGIMSLIFREGMDQYDVKDTWPSATVKSVEDLDIDPQECIYFINNSNKSIDKYSLDRNKLASIPRETDQYKIRSMDRLAIDLLGNVYVLDKKTPAIFIFASDQHFIQQVALDTKYEDIAVNYRGEILLINSKDNRIDLLY